MQTGHEHRELTSGTFLRIFEKKVFCGYKSQIFFIRDKNVWHRHRMAEAEKGAETVSRDLEGVSGGSGGHFTGLMAVLHLLPRFSEDGL